MDLFQFFTYLKQFNADVALIGIAVWGLTFVCKRTLLKKLKRKYITLLPFLLGIALYAGYLAIVGGLHADQETFGKLISQGITCGSLATVIHVVYEQFIRSGAAKTDIKAACVQSLLADFCTLTDEQASELAQNIAADEEKAQKQLSEFVGEDTAKILYPALKNTLQTL